MLGSQIAGPGQLKRRCNMTGNMETESKGARTRAVVKARTGGSADSPEELHQVIAVTAYHLAERRNFEPGHEMEDWLNAEAQVLAERESLKGLPA
jgi:hypothetical protein